MVHSSELVLAEMSGRLRREQRSQRTASKSCSEEFTDVGVSGKDNG